MSAIFPNTVKNFSTQSNRYINELQEEVAAIETKIKSSAIVELASIADDAVFSMTPANPSGFMLVRIKGGDAAVITYDAIAGTAYCKVVAGTADIEAAVGALVGTTGTDAKLTISAHTDGKLYIENRLGAAKVLGYVML